MRRIYFLVPDVPTARRVVEDLLLARIGERHLHVIARRGTPLEDLPEASLLQKTDFVPAVQRGALLGWSIGLLAGLVAVAVPTVGPVIAGGAVLGTSFAGAGVGALASGLVGMGIGNSRIRQFEAAIEAGHVLVLADVPRDRVEELEARVRAHVPGLEIERTEPHIPAFP